MSTTGKDRLDQLADEVDLALGTYRHLRMVLIALPLLLLVGSIAAATLLDVVQESISAYYLTPIRDVFVGAMVGIAVCLVAYRGAPLEDFALNLAGFYAVFVAFVPTGLGATLARLSPERRAETLQGVQAATISVLVVSAAFVYAQRRVTRDTADELRKRRLTSVLFVVSTILVVGFVLLVLWRIIDLDAEFGGVHLTATLLLIASLAMAVATHGWPDPMGKNATPLRRYRLITYAMLGGIPLVAILRFWVQTDYATLITEWWEIALFALFWISETKLTWDKETRQRAEA
jgi:hypothetical protein